jgi:putative tricarboxylic transport membrane protein
MKKKSILLGSWLLILLSGWIFTAESQAQKFLTRPIEFVCHAAPGGGSDIMARMMQSIIDKEKITTHPIAVVNRPGGSGAVAFAYVAGKKGDPHYWLTATTSFLTTPLLGKSKYTYKDFTPLTNLAFDDFLVVVGANTPYMTLENLVDGARKKPGDIKVGGTYAPGTDALIVHLIEKEAKVKFNYIPFKSGGEAMVALLGGHIEVFLANPCEALAQVEAKKARMLGITSQKRLDLLPDVPTLKEKGINVVAQQFRSIVAPPNLSTEAVKFYEDLFQRLAESKMWKEKYIKENMLTPDYKTSVETQKMLEKDNASCTAVLKDMKVIK